MKKLNILILIVLLFLIQYKALSQNLLPEKWKFRTGDNLEWAKPQFDDNGWQEILSGNSWENQGFIGYDGFAWYRATIVFPSTLKADAEKYGGFALLLGRIDDADWTYFNGEFLDKTGDLPPKYVTKYYQQRNYTIPLEKIKWDKPNVIAIRVFDGTGAGGMYAGLVGIVIKGIAEKFTISTIFRDTTRIFKGVTNVVLPVAIQNEVNQNFTGKWSVKLTNDFKKALLERSYDLKIDSNSTKYDTLTIRNIEAGFYKCVTKFESEKISKINTFWFGVEPEKVISKPDFAPDFQSYWDKARQELAAVNPQFKVTKKPKFCTATHNVYLVEMQSLDNVLVRGWYSVPTKKGKYPAILHVQGFGSVMSASSIKDSTDFVSFALNIRGHGNSCDNVNPGFQNYLKFNVNDKEKYIYRGAYMDCIRAIDFLCSRAEVDTSRIAVEGASQGGALSYATAALDNKRVKLCVAAVPFLSDFRHYFQVADWPGNEFFNYVEKNPNTTIDQVYNTLSYIDIKNLAGWIKCPVLMSVGLFDDTCPPRINFAAYNNLNCPKEYRIYPISGHGLPNEYKTFRIDYIRKKFGMN